MIVSTTSTSKKSPSPNSRTFAMAGTSWVVVTSMLQLRGCARRDMVATTRAANGNQPSVS